MTKEQQLTEQLSNAKKLLREIEIAIGNFELKHGQEATMELHDLIVKMEALQDRIKKAESLTGQ